MLLVAVCVSDSCVMARCLPEFMVETSYHINATIYK